MRAILGLLPLCLLSGCLILYPAAVGAVALAPAVAPLSGAADGKGDGVLEAGAVHAGGDDEHEVQGGWGGAFRSLGFMGNDGPALMMGGRVEVGGYGRDRIYGMSGLDVGPAFRVPQLGAFAVSAGYRYGGYPQNGHSFPFKATLYIAPSPAFALHASLYAGWRIGVRDEYPAATRTIGPGWNTWGGDVSASVGGVKGIFVGVTIDREDDIKTVSIHFGASMRPAANQ
jgi:hypothetical protein